MRLTVAHGVGHFNRFFTELRKRQKKPPFPGSAMVTLLAGFRNC